MDMLSAQAALKSTYTVGEALHNRVVNDLKMQLNTCLPRA